MNGAPIAPAILDGLRSICLALPETHEEPAWVGLRWRVRTRTFAHVVRIEGGEPPAFARSAGTDGPPGGLVHDAGVSGPADPPRPGEGGLGSEPVFANGAVRPASGSSSPLRILGVDPGLTRCGYAIVDGNGPGDAVAIALGVIRTPPSDPLPQRLAALKLELAGLIAEFRPAAVAVESVFFQVNVRTAMSVGQASGLALAEAATAGCDVAQYTPNQVKDAVAGYGAAPKEQVQKMVQARLRLSAPPKPADAADAAALALCHLAMAPMRRRIAAAAVGGRR